MYRKQFVSLFDRILLILLYWMSIDYIRSIQLPVEKQLLLFLIANLVLGPLFYWLIWRTLSLKFKGKLSFIAAAYEIDKNLFSRKNKGQLVFKKLNLIISGLVIALTVSHFLLVHQVDEIRNSFYFIELIPLFISYRYITNYLKFGNS